MNADTDDKAVTKEEIDEYEEEHGEPHPVFEVDHRPERHSLEQEEDAFVFYVYDDDEDDPRFSFWLETAQHGGMSLYERPPDGRGMWLKPESGSDYGGKAPTDELRGVLADLLNQEVSAERVHDLPAHERHFTQVIHGTIERDADAIPGPVWSFMHECAATRGESDE